MANRWEERRERFAAARSFRRLMDRSSLAEEKLYGDCPKCHRRTAKHPHRNNVCIICGTSYGS